MATRIGRPILLLGILIGLLPGGIWTSSAAWHAQAGGIGTPVLAAMPSRPPDLAPALRLAGALRAGDDDLLLTLRNAGPGPTTGPIALRVTLPLGVSYALPAGASAARFRLAGGWTCAAQPLRQVQCARDHAAALAPGARTRLALALRVAEVLPGAAVQAAAATAGDADPAHAVATLALWPGDTVRAPVDHGRAVAAGSPGGPAATTTPSPARRLLALLAALRRRAAGTLPPLPALIPPAGGAPGSGPLMPRAPLTVTRPALLHAGANAAALAIQAGWNLITLPLQPTAPIDATTVLAGLLGSTHGALAALYGLTAGAWSPSLLRHGAATSGRDFALAYGRGYLLYSDKSGSLTLSGAASGAAPVWSLAPGWNLVGFPLGATGAVSATATLRGLLAVTGGRLAALYGLADGAWSPSAIVQANATSGADFALQAGSGYLLYADIGTLAFAVPGFLPPDPTTVAPPVDPTVATTVYTGTQFIYSGPDPIQTGVAPGTIELTRTAVLRGLVADRTGAPLPGVTVSVLGHPEFGQTVSRADGMYDLVVNGGGLLTLSYVKSGLIPAQRQVRAPWQDYARVPDVALLPYDPRVSAVAAGGSGEQVAQGSMQRDADGQRQATLLFAPGTTATMTMPDGSVRPLPGPWHVRATEFTVGTMGPASMPGPLPASSGFTYAAEFSIDEAVAAGATGVQFSQPVSVYVQDFLTFPVGVHVPIGYYDRAAHQWVAADDGRVVKILSIGGGKAVLDVDGSGNPATAAELQALGITGDELTALAQQFASDVGQSFWRVAITHFTPWDPNWPYGPPPGAPAPPGAPRPPQPNNPNGPCQNPGSIIGCQDQTLGQTIPIPGAPFALRYSSARAPGRSDDYSLHLQIMGDSVPPALKRAELVISVAGRTFSTVWQAAELSPLQQYTFTWDGKDAYGRTLQGPQPYTYDLAYVYPAVYQEPAQLARTFAAYSGIPMTNVSSIDGGLPTGREVYIHAFGNGTFGTLAALGSDLGGWTPDILNHYDPNQHVLYLGDGRVRDVSSLAPVAIEQPTSFQGQGDQCQSPCEGGNFAPIGAAYAPDGTMYYIEGDSVVRRLADGTETIIAGRGLPAPPDGLGDGGPAVQARFDFPTGIALGHDGSIYIADAFHGRVRRFLPGGIITTVAGGGTPADGIGDNGPATRAALTWPWGVAVGPDGSLYIADAGMCRVRRVGPDGTITTVAGTDLPNPYNSGLCAGFGGDNGPAVKAELNQPENVAVGPDGSIYIEDFKNNRVRRVAPDGIITTIAGSGACNLTAVGASGPALQANLCLEGGLAVGADGTVYLATDQGGTLIGAVYPDGRLEIVAGTGNTTYACPYNDNLCKNGPATNAVLGYVYGLTLAPDGKLEICDDSENIFYRVSSALPDLGAANDYIASDDGRQIFAFDASGRHLATLDALTNAVLYAFTYDANGLLIGIVDGSGNVTAIQRDALGNPTAIVAPGGRRTTLTTDANGYLTGVTDPLGHTTRMTTAANGLLTSFTTPNGALHQFTYDAQGLLTKDQGSDGESTTLTRVVGTDAYTVTVTTALGTATSYVVARLADGSSRQTRIDPGGARTVVTYGTDGSQTAAYPDGSKLVIHQSADPRWGMAAPVSSSITYTTPSGKTRTIGNARSAGLSTPGNLLSLSSLGITSMYDGATSSTTYDAASRTITTSTPAGRFASSTLDTLGRVISWRPDPSLSPLTYTYNGQGRIVNAQEGSQFETYTYNAALELSSRTNAAGQVWRYGYDADGNLTTLTLPGGEVYTLGYDADGNQTSITMPSGAVHTLQYNALDQPAGYTPPGGTGGIARAYDAEQRLTTVTLPDGRSSTRGYDTADRLHMLQYPEATITYSYAANNATDPVNSILRTPVSIGTAQTVGYTYDGQVLTGSTLSGAATGQFSYGYDANLVLNAITVHSGAGAVAIPVGHDADGLLTGFGSLALARNGPVGLQSGVTDGSAMRIDETYDGLGELTSRKQTVQGTVTLSDTYSYDAAGRISQAVEQVGGASHTYAYAYDADGQLTQVTRDGTTSEHYTYDANGNRTSRTLNGGSPESASYDNRDRLLQRGGASYSFNAAGFLTGRGGDGFTYSEMGELLKATVGGKTVTYSYDGLGRRVSRTDSGGATQYLYGNPSDVFQVTAVRDPSGTLTVLYYDGDGHLVALDRGGSRSYVATDLLGTPRVVTSAAGTVVKSLTYDSYGDLLSDSAPGFSLPIGYAGGLADPVTGLVHFGFRDYEPASGRWTAIDLALYGGGQENLYAYVGNDPVDFRDPTGLFCVGASGYGGIGVGTEICITDKGVSACIEAGVGAGESEEVNPFGGLATQGFSLVAEVQASAEVGTTAATWTLTPCLGKDHLVALSNDQVDLKILAAGQGIKGSVSQSGNADPQASLDFSFNKFGEDDLGKIGIEGKVAAKYCEVALF